MSDFHFHITRDETARLVATLALWRLKGDDTRVDSVGATFAAMEPQLGLPSDWSTAEEFKCLNLDASDVANIILAFVDSLDPIAELINDEPSANMELLVKLDEQTGGQMLRSAMAMVFGGTL